LYNSYFIEITEPSTKNVYVSAGQLRGNRALIKSAFSNPIGLYTARIVNGYFFASGHVCYATTIQQLQEVRSHVGGHRFVVKGLVLLAGVSRKNN
jgi:hypothetical protein